MSPLGIEKCKDRLRALARQFAQSLWSKTEFASTLLNDISSLVTIFSFKGLFNLCLVRLSSRHLLITLQLLLHKLHHCTLIKSTRCGLVITHVWLIRFSES
ncbi:hypothetical protein D3C86_1243340 [compost metagenome]